MRAELDCKHDARLSAALEQVRSAMAAEAEQRAESTALAERKRTALEVETVRQELGRSLYEHDAACRSERKGGPRALHVARDALLFTALFTVRVQSKNIRGHHNDAPCASAGRCSLKQHSSAPASLSPM